MTQDNALKILKGTNNVFLTGQPGTGKTYLINQYIEWCVDNGIIPTVTASTGIAATHVRGITLHSWAGVRDDNTLSTQDMDDILDNPWVRERICKTDILIIDEISMVSAKLLNVVNKLAMTARADDRAFGGIKVIAVGDFYQLPPVKGDFAFESESWKMADFTVCYLHEQHRQSDQVFNNILTGIRAGSLTDEQKSTLRSRLVTDTSGLEAIRLDTHNDKVDKINEAKLDRLPGIPKIYLMDKEGNETALKALINNCLSPERLLLKVGAPVLFTKNDIDKQWVNGTMGKIIALHDEMVTVELKSSERVNVTPQVWERAEGYGKNKNVIASIMQLPLRLAWAITLHKSQGMTLDSAIIDVTNVFACGHAYVGVSRVKTLDGLYFQGRLTKGFLKVDDKVKDFDKVINTNN
jgi:ATP-dependent DNA helicase PIF1